MAHFLLKTLPWSLLVLSFSGFTAADGPRVTVKHEGQPTGEIKAVNGINMYHAYPADKKVDNAILFLTDIFGVALPQNRLLADSFASAGYLVVMPDYFKGDPIPVDQTGFDRNGWRAKHPGAEVETITEATIKYMRNELKVKKIGAVGYCFGGPYTAKFSAKGKGLDAGFVAHPGAIDAAEWKAISVPFSIAAAETDQSFNSTQRFKAEEIFMKQNATYQINVYSGTQHGFAIRVDLSNKRQLFGKESAFYQAVRWFDEWLKGISPSASQGRFIESSGQDLRVQHDFAYSS